MESCSHAYHTSRVVHAASGASFSTCLPPGSVNSADSSSAARLLACSRRRPVSQTRYWATALNSGSTLRSLQHWSGRGLIQQAMLRFLLGHCLFGKQVDQIQMPLARNAVAIFVRFAEVVAGIEKEDGNVRVKLQRQLGEQHVLGLKAAREANVALANDRVAQRGADVVQFCFNFCVDFDGAH